MTRRKKVLFYTWLLSWALAGPWFIAAAWVWWLCMGAPSDFEPRQYASYIEFEAPALHVLRVYGPLMIGALAAGPVVYVSWRIVNRFVPDDEEE